MGGPDLSGEPFPVCTHCGFTWEEYRARGLLGCPHCYAAFGDALQADIAWLHGALEMGQPDPASASAASALTPDALAEWRERLSDAVRSENYEEAARLRRLIRDSPSGHGPVAEGAQGGEPGLGLG